MPEGLIKLALLCETFLSSLQYYLCQCHLPSHYKQPSLLQVAAAKKIWAHNSQPVSEINNLKPEQWVELISYFNFLFTPHKVMMATRCKFASFLSYIPTHNNLLSSFMSNLQAIGANALEANDKQLIKDQQNAHTLNKVQSFLIYSIGCAHVLLIWW